MTTHTIPPEIESIDLPMGYWAIVRGQMGLFVCVAISPEEAAEFLGHEYDGDKDDCDKIEECLNRALLPFGRTLDTDCVGDEEGSHFFPLCYLEDFSDDE